MGDPTQTELMHIIIYHLKQWREAAQTLDQSQEGRPREKQNLAGDGLLSLHKNLISQTHCISFAISSLPLFSVALFSATEGFSSDAIMISKALLFLLDSPGL